MSRKSKKKGAVKLEAQARAHEALYGGDWGEVTEYRKQALRIVTRLGLKLENGDVSIAALKLFAKRLEEYGSGKRKMRGELPFLRVLRTVREGSVLDYGNETDVWNFRILEGLGYIRQGTLTGKGKILLKALTSKI